MCKLNILYHDGATSTNQAGDLFYRETPFQQQKHPFVILNIPFYRLQAVPAEVTVTSLGHGAEPPPGAR